jgi:hypothetical protein
MTDIKRIPAQPEMVQVTITMTPEEYDQISNNAAWQSGGGIGRYMIDAALGKTRRGC